MPFAGTQPPYSAFGKFLNRVGTQNRKMSRDELVKMVRKIYYTSDWERKISHSVEDIDDKTLQAYFSKAVECGRLSMDSYDKEILLSTLGLLDDEKVLNAGHALFGKGEPIGLKLACYVADEKLTFLDLTEERGNTYNLINEAVRYIEKNINWRVEIGARKRIEIPEVPIRALREIVVNAFAHAEYSNCPVIEIDIHPGKIAIFNPGSFPDDLTPNDFIRRDLQSMKRNPLILGALFRCKDVEQSRTGFRRMNDLCEEANVKWTFESFAHGFSFEFKRKTREVAKRTTIKKFSSQQDKCASYTKRSGNLYENKRKL